MKRARARGDLETAFQLLRAETRRSARNRDVVLLFWEIAVEHDQTEAAAPAMLQLIREELRRGALDAAVSQWRRLGERVPGALLDPATLLKLLPLIRSKLGDDAAVLALHQAVDPANRGFTPELGAEIARAAAEIEPEVARKAATRALQAKGIAPELASEMNALVARLQPPSERRRDGGAAAGGDRLVRRRRRPRSQRLRRRRRSLGRARGEGRRRRRGRAPRRGAGRAAEPRRAGAARGGGERSARGLLPGRARRQRGAALARRGRAR